MGVQGLTTFIDHNQHLLTEVKLHDTKVIIDGNNLCHFIYYYFNIQPRFTGDYDDYARSVRFYFDTFRQCNIQCYVVLDGGMDANDWKLRTVLERAKDRLEMSHKVACGARGKVLPILAYDVFCRVMKELEIPLVMCDFEADKCIASLAHQWNCPVLSNDSDFFIFDLPEGCILIDYLNLKVRHEKTEDGAVAFSYLAVQMYYLSTFLDELSGVDKALVPLFGTVLGNDFVTRATFQLFYTLVGMPKSTTKRYHNPNKFSKIISLLHWLSLMKSLPQAMDMVLTHYPMPKKKTVENLVQQSIAFYQTDDTSLREYFEDDVIQENTLVSHTGKVAPVWFVRSLRQGDLFHTAVDVLVHHRDVLLSQVEKMTLDSTYTCSRDLRLIMYSILFTLEDLNQESEVSPKCKVNHVVEYDRERMAYKTVYLRPLRMLPSGVSVPTLSEIPSLSIEKRQDFICQALGINITREDIEFLGDLALVVFAVLHWVSHATPKVNSLHVSSLLLCLIKLSIIDPHAPELKGERKVAQYPCSEAEQGDGATFHSLDRQWSRPELKLAFQNLQRYVPQPKVKSRYEVDDRVLHAFGQFQTCFLALLRLNQVLLSPFPNMNPGRVFCGTLSYNLYKDLKKRANPTTFTSLLLGEDSALSSFHFDLVSFINQHLPTDRLKSCLPGRKNVSSREGKKKGKKRKTNQEPESDDDEDRNSSDEVEITCDVSNKFSCLDVKDS